MAAALAVVRSIRVQRRGSLTEESASFASKLPSLDRGDVIHMDRVLDTLLNQVNRNLFNHSVFVKT